jgi:carbamoyl-phosphate synthase large subunit
VHTLEEGLAAVDFIGLPAVIRPSFTLAGTGGGIAYNMEEFRGLVAGGLGPQPTTEVLVEESVVGWKEFEMEVVRDKADNCIIVCSIENIDPMGVHTGDSITVAPALTLTDKEYQRMRTASIAVLREIGVETGGSNVQFALNPRDGRMLVIEMNPRVSRSSALASKATGWPIAKIAGQAGRRLHARRARQRHHRRDARPRSSRPSTTWSPRSRASPFEKYPGAEPHLTTSMKSVGEVMAIGRTFAESMQKALRGLETGLTGFDEIAIAGVDAEDEAGVRAAVVRALGQPTPDRLRVIAQAFRHGLTVEEVEAACSYEPWFLRQIAELVGWRASWRPGCRRGGRCSASQGDGLFRRAPRQADEPDRSGRARGAARPGRPPGVQAHRHLRRRVRGQDPVYVLDLRDRRVRARPQDDEADPSDRRKAIILGGGPNRIGQGIEFDYCCVHAAFAMADLGIESIMVNCNPETVSTDYDTSDRLYFEPLTAEDVLELIAVEQSRGTLLGVIVQFGGQTPLKLAQALEDAGVPILGTSPDAIDLAEDRERFQQLLQRSDCSSRLTPPPAPPSRRSRRRTRSATPSSSAPPTCWAAGAWRSSATTSSWPATSATPSRSAATHRC